LPWLRFNPVTWIIRCRSARQ